jgi:16S rRNA processing protein RimM
LTSDAPLLEVGRITRAHGLRGDVVIAPISNRPERFAAGAELLGDERTFRIERVRPQGATFVAHLEGVDDRDSAERLRNTMLYGTPLGELADDELWVHELIGSDCVDVVGNELGRIEAVQDNPAHDLLVLTGGALVPMVFVVEHDPAARRVVVDLPEGLLELYR